MGAEGGYCSIKLKKPDDAFLQSILFDSFKFVDYCHIEDNKERYEYSSKTKIYCDWKAGFGEDSTLDTLPEIIQSIFDKSGYDIYHGDYILFTHKRSQ